MTPQETPTPMTQTALPTTPKQLLDLMYSMRDRNSPMKFIAVNKAMNEEIKELIFQPSGHEYKAVIEAVAGFTYIVSPYFKDQENPQATISHIDLNKVASINSVYEGESVYIEDILFGTIHTTWLTKNLQPSEQPTEENEPQATN